MVSRACFGALTHLMTARKQNILLAGSAFFPLSLPSRLQTSWMMLSIFRVGFLPLVSHSQKHFKMHPRHVLY